MIKLKKLIRLNEWGDNKLPDPSLGKFILESKVKHFSGHLYHGSPLDGLKSMLADGISGTQHGEIAEYETFSTSINKKMLRLFSEGNGDSGLVFNVEHVSLIVLDDILHKLLIKLPGSGMSIDIDETKMEEFCERFKVPIGSDGEPYLPYGYLSSLGIDSFMYEYVWKLIHTGRRPEQNDESEICFIGDSIGKLNNCIESFYVDGQEFDIKEKELALNAIEELL